MIHYSKNYLLNLLTPCQNFQKQYPIYALIVYQALIPRYAIMSYPYPVHCNVQTYGMYMYEANHNWNLAKLQYMSQIYSRNSDSYYGMQTSGTKP